MTAVRASGATPDVRTGPGADLDVLLLNLRTDSSDTALGFTTSWINALARRVRSVSVVTMFAGRIAVEPNVRVFSVGKERGYSEPRRVAEFYRHVHRITRERPIDVCFSHMNPKFSVLFAPIAHRRGIPHLLWYAHGSVPLALRVADRVVDRCITPTEASFRLASDKLHVTGHGIDTYRFRASERRPDGYDRTLVSVGRITPRKQIGEMLEAVSLLRARGADVRIELTGEPLTDADAGYERDLRRRADRPDLAGAVTFPGRVPYEEVAPRYHQGLLFVNVSGTASMDKAILEAMASGCVPISRNESFARLAADHGLDALVPPPGAVGLADCIARALDQTAAERADLTERLRRIVVDEHGLEPLTDKIVAHLVELADERAG